MPREIDELAKLISSCAEPLLSEQGASFERHVQEWSDKTANVLLFEKEAKIMTTLDDFNLRPLHGCESVLRTMLRVMREAYLIGRDHGRRTHGGEPCESS